ncbi:hypothetical protein SRHO_G00321520 [Serrasalmus rhombeus]
MWGTSVVTLVKPLSHPAEETQDICLTIKATPHRPVSQCGCLGAGPVKVADFDIVLIFPPPQGEDDAVVVMDACPACQT